MLRIILGVYSRAENTKIIHPKIQPKKKNPLFSGITALETGKSGRGTKEKWHESNNTHFYNTRRFALLNEVKKKVPQITRFSVQYLLPRLIWSQ